MQNLGIYEIPIIAQAYDGASVMSGIHNGLHMKIKKDHPNAIYIHCMAHKLNLVIVNSIKSNEDAVEFFNTIQSLYVLFANPINNHLLKLICSEKNIKNLEINSLSETRWACRYVL